MEIWMKCVGRFATAKIGKKWPLEGVAGTLEMDILNWNAEMGGYIFSQIKSCFTRNRTFQYLANSFWP
jgi:hypothetical protein